MLNDSISQTYNLSRPVGYPAKELGWPSGKAGNNTLPPIDQTPARAAKERKRNDPYYKLFGTNYFPVCPAIAKALGLHVAVVFGRIAAYCQMDSKHCTASQSKIAKECGLSLHSTQRAIEKCLEFSLIEVDPNWKVGTTRRYSITKRAVDIISPFQTGE